MYCVLSVVSVAEVEGGRVLGERFALAGMAKRRWAEMANGRKGRARSAEMYIFAILLGDDGGLS